MNMTTFMIYTHLSRFVMSEVTVYSWPNVGPGRGCVVSVMIRRWMDGWMDETAAPEDLEYMGWSC